RVERSGEGGPVSAFEPSLSETPSTSTKPQAPEKFQISNTNPPKQTRGKRSAGRFLSLELGASLELGTWTLELVAWALGFLKIDPGKACWRTAPMGQVTTVARRLSAFANPRGRIDSAHVQDAPHHRRTGAGDRDGRGAFHRLVVGPPPGHRRAAQNPKHGHDCPASPDALGAGHRQVRPRKGGHSRRHQMVWRKPGAARRPWDRKGRRGLAGNQTRGRPRRGQKDPSQTAARPDHRRLSRRPENSRGGPLHGVVARVRQGPGAKRAPAGRRRSAYRRAFQSNLRSRRGTGATSARQSFPPAWLRS